MSKPWFLKLTMEAEPSPLAATIAKVLKKEELPIEYVPTFSSKAPSQAQL
jgi:cystathionine beta-synthase